MLIFENRNACGAAVGRSVAMGCGASAEANANAKPPTNPQSPSTPTPSSKCEKDEPPTAKAAAKAQAVKLTADQSSRAAAILQALDDDGDGSLSSLELDKLEQFVGKESLHSIDANRDQRITLEEWKSFLEGLGEADLVDAALDWCQDSIDKRQVVAPQVPQAAHEVQAAAQEAATEEKAASGAGHEAKQAKDEAHAKLAKVRQ